MQNFHHTRTPESGPHDLLWKQAFQELLHRYPTQQHSPLQQALNHTLKVRGKQWRAQLCLRTAAMMASSESGAACALPAALAVEMVHGYSLIHDDLPAMDDSDMRRGQPALHKTFGEATAILAGDALLTDAFGLLSEWPAAVSPVVRCSWTEVLARSAGSRGMVLGQAYDTAAWGQKACSVEFIEQVYAYKSGGLCVAALQMAALAADCANDEGVMELLLRLGNSIGIAYQIQDDFTDISEDNDGQHPGFSLVAAVGDIEALERYHHHKRSIQQGLQNLGEFGGLWRWLTRDILNMQPRAKEAGDHAQRD